MTSFNPLSPTPDIGYNANSFGRDLVDPAPAAAPSLGYWNPNPFQPIVPAGLPNHRLPRRYPGTFPGDNFSPDPFAQPVYTHGVRQGSYPGYQASSNLFHQQSYGQHSGMAYGMSPTNVHDEGVMASINMLNLDDDPLPKHFVRPTLSRSATLPRSFDGISSLTQEGHLRTSPSQTVGAARVASGF